MLMKATAVHRSSAITPSAEIGSPAAKIAIVARRARVPDQPRRMKNAGSLIYLAADLGSTAPASPSWSRRSSSRAHRACPEFLRRRSRRGRSRARPSPRLRCGRQAPPQIGFAGSCVPNCSVLSLFSLGADGNLLDHKAGVHAGDCGRPWTAVFWSSGAPPDLPHRPPSFISRLSPASPSWLRRSSSRSHRTPPPSSSVASAAAVDGNLPPQIGSAQAARRTAPIRALLGLIADGDLPTHKAGWDAPETAAAKSRPPFLRRAHPSPAPPALFHFPRPRAPQRAVAFRTFPPPSARELPAPGSGGGGANAGREFR
jgi:hypothetical protein